MLAGPAPPVVLDVRPPRERRFARIDGDVAIPLSDLPGRVSGLPEGRAIVVYCQYGNLARLAARFLLDHGRTGVAALEGGIDEYSRVVDPTIPRYPEGGGGALLVRQLPRFDSGCLAYLVSDVDAREAIVIDPGRDPAPYLAAAGAEGDRIVAIVETHTHADHLAGHAELHARTGAPIFVGKRSPAEYPHRTLSEGEAVRFGAHELVAWETPGHTLDHLTLSLPGRLFTGDTLLVGACGRTDLGGGSPDLLFESLREKILRAPDTSEILPAHFGAKHALAERFGSTLGFERATNEVLQIQDREAFRKYMTEGWPPKPANFDAIVAENLRH